MLGDVAPRQNDLSAAFWTNVSAFGTTFVAYLLNEAENPERRFASIELSSEIASWALKLHFIFYLKCHLWEQDTKGDA